MKRHALLTLFLLASTSSAHAQSAPGRWGVEVGVTWAPIRPASVSYAIGHARIATTGPIEWSFDVASHRVATLHRAAVVSGLEYCPGYPGGVCPGTDDHSEVAGPFTAGLSVRLARLPFVLNRLIVQLETGGYYAPWRNLPWYDADRRALLTGYCGATTGIRFTPHVALALGATEFRNVRHRDSRTAYRLGLEVRWP